MRQAVIRILRGIAGAVRNRSGVFVGVTAGVFVLDLLLPPALLSVVRKPFDYVAFNAWLPELPRYLLSSDLPLQEKLEFIPNLALFWFSADSAFGGVDWGFAVTVSDLLRILLLSLLFGAMFYLRNVSRKVRTFISNRKGRQLVGPVTAPELEDSSAALSNTVLTKSEDY